MPYENTLIVPVVLGKDGIYGIRNADRVPLGSARLLRNVSMEDRTLRTEGGAASLGVAIGSSGLASFDYFPTQTQQRTVTAFADGTVRKDDGNGTYSAALVSGLTTSGQIPHFVKGGAEQLGNNVKLFMADRVNAVRVLSGDGTVMTTISNPPADWSGANQPFCLCAHAGFLWGALGDRVYRSSILDHEDFLTFPYQRPIFPGVGEYISAMWSYKGFLVIWKFPRGVFLLDTRNAAEANWTVTQVGPAGAVGPYNVTGLEDDVLSIDPAGGWHLISQTQASGSVRASDITAKKLGAFMRERINLAQLATAQLVYYGQKAVAMLACHQAGLTTKNVRIHMDVLDVAEIGEKWSYSDRDRNEALFMRKSGNFEIPAMTDANGKLWELDRTNRSQDGAAFTFYWNMWDTDFAAVLGQAVGRRTAGRFLQLEYDPRNAATHTITALRDGQKSQVISFSLVEQPAVLPQVLPFILGESTPRRTRPKRLKGIAYRWGFSGLTTTAADVSLMKLYIGLDVLA
jgi:hypothetical protein